MHHVDQFGNIKSHHFLDPFLDPQRLGDSRNPVPPSVLMFIECDVASAPLPSCMPTTCNVASTPLPSRVFIARDAASAPLPSLRPRHAMRRLPLCLHTSPLLTGWVDFPSFVCPSVHTLPALKPYHFILLPSPYVFIAGRRTWLHL